MKGYKLYTLIKDDTKVRVVFEEMSLYGYTPAEEALQYGATILDLRP